MLLRRDGDIAFRPALKVGSLPEEFRREELSSTELSFLLLVLFVEVVLLLLMWLLPWLL